MVEMKFSHRDRKEIEKQVSEKLNDMLDFIGTKGNNNLLITLRVEVLK